MMDNDSPQTMPMKAAMRRARAPRSLGLALALALTCLAVLQGCAGLLLVGGATAVVAANDRRTFGAQIDDKAIVVKSTNAINSDKNLTGDVHINVTSVNGVALLTGEAPSTEARDRVLTDVRGVSGVRRTVNEIRMAPPSTASARGNDSWLTGKVKSKLLGVSNLDSSQIKVVTENSVVYLMGLVKKEEGELATNATAEVGDVARVVKLFEYLD